MTDLPGMWEYADFMGGSDDIGPATYWKQRAERAEAERQRLESEVKLLREQRTILVRNIERAGAEVERLRTATTYTGRGADARDQS